MHSDKVVIFGMSCVGKTHFAQTLIEHCYYCFDALFDWDAIETMDLSISANLQAVKDACVGDRYVLDGWHLADKEGLYLPIGCTVYVLFADYERVIRQYRVEVRHPDEHRGMFEKW